MKLIQRILVGAVTLSLVLVNFASADHHGQEEMPPGAKEFFETLQQTGGDFDAAFNAAEAVAKADAEANDPDYNSEEWAKCKEAALSGMQGVLENSEADNMEDKAKEAFGAAMWSAQFCSGDLPPEEQAFFTVLEETQGDAQQAFEAAANAAGEVAKAEIENDGGTWDEYAQEEFNKQRSQALEVFQSAMQEGNDPRYAFGEVMAAMYEEGQDGEGHEDGQHQDGGHHGDGPPMGKDHWEGNCMALCSGHDRYMVEGDDTEFGIWTKDGDGNDVNCGCGDGYEDKGQHEGGQHEGGQHEGGQHEGMTELDHMMNGLRGMLDAMVNDGNLDAGDADYMMELAEGLEEATHAEHQSDDNTGKAGEAMQAAQDFLAQQGAPEQVAKDYMHQLCMIEWATHKENGSTEPPQCGHPGGDCGHFKMNEDGSVMVSTPDGNERWLMQGDFEMNEDGSITITKQGEPDTGATVTPPPCDDGDGSGN